MVAFVVFDSVGSAEVVVDSDIDRAWVELDIFKSVTRVEENIEFSSVFG